MGPLGQVGSLLLHVLARRLVVFCRHGSCTFAIGEVAFGRWTCNREVDAERLLCEVGVGVWEVGV